jgi:CDP-glucose 4,6-dehydratase
MKQLSIFSGARVLVTGHTGFKGSWLCLWLNQLGAEVYGISVNVPSSPSHFEVTKLESLLNDNRLDIKNYSNLKSLVTEIKPDFVFHLAAQALVKPAYDDPLETWHTNTIGTINILESLRELKTNCVAIFITSDKCYDNVELERGYLENDKLGGPDPYSASKGAAEIAISSYVRSFFPRSGSIRIGIGRAGNVIGGGDWAKDRIIPDCIRAWSQQKIVNIRNPIATRPWQHVLEPLSGYLNLAVKLKLSAKLHGQPYNFGPPADQNHSVGELVSLMTTHWDHTEWNDVSPEYGGPYESTLLKLNCKKALDELNWRAVSNFETTVRETTLWYREFYKNQKNTMLKFSTDQILSYVNKAKELGEEWTK